MSTAMPEFVAGELARYQGGGARGMALSDERILVMLSQMNQLAQNMTEINQGISGGAGEDQAMVAYVDQQLYAITQGEGAMNSVMEGFTTNLEKLTASNAATSTAIANSITSNANLIDTANNMATTVDRTFNTLTRGLTHAANIAGEILTLGLGTENREFMQASQFLGGDQLSGFTQKKGIVGNFAGASEDMLSVLQKKDKKGQLSDDQINSRIYAYENLTKELISSQGGTDESNKQLISTSEKTLVALTALLNEIVQK
jgi:hypothetical protein